MKWWGARHDNEVAPLGLLLTMDWDRLKYLFVAWLSEPPCTYCATEVAFRIIAKYWLGKTTNKKFRTIGQLSDAINFGPKLKELIIYSNFILI